MISNEVKTVLIGLAALGGCIGVFFLGWMTILWTAIGCLIGFIAKKVHEETLI